jgi:predicted GIY-YIG superfamily endonuclease
VSDFADTYLLECGDGNLYVGSAIDLKRRMQEHSRGAVPATQYRLP